MLANVIELERKYNNNMVGEVLETFDYAPPWQALTHAVDNTLRMHFGQRELLEYYKSVDEREVQADFEVLLYAYLKSKEVEYTKLYKVSITEYEPIENYRMTETEQIRNSTDNMYGERRSEETFLNSGREETLTNEIGTIETDNTTTHGAQNSDFEEINEVAPYDNENFAKESAKRGVNNSAEYCDTNNEIVKGRTDTQTNTSVPYEDIVHRTDNSYGDTIYGETERELTRHGNIGVTTSQQMLESEIALANKMNVAEKIAKDVANIISKGVYYAL